MAAGVASHSLPVIPGTTERTRPRGCTVDRPHRQRQVRVNRGRSCERIAKANKMATQLNHLIIPARDKEKSARFLAGILGLEVGRQWAHFLPVQTSNGVTLDFSDSSDFRPQHYAFLISESEFDAALLRLREAAVEFYADFDLAGPGEINHLYGGRGLYFRDPSGHLLEIITKPYGPEPQRWQHSHG
jgi:catechol 2,3-dioxygenase-like lactoylglutathione lyase family enzyme